MMHFILWYFNELHSLGNVKLTICQFDSTLLSLDNPLWDLMFGRVNTKIIVEHILKP